ncbi:hypothetical protein [Escherichia coli]|uniref:hypothetical protein n=1 Tax=Escherichia coli TaxID=562 RepID=UPI002948C1C3|nr:hypothetical protein [Escherichia coli]
MAFDGSSDITLKASHVGAFALGKTGSTVANDKAVGWNSITLGDNNTGIKWCINVNYSFLNGQLEFVLQAHLLIFIKMAVFSSGFSP